MLAICADLCSFWTKRGVRGEVFDWKVDMARRTGLGLVFVFDVIFELGFEGHF